MIQEIKISNNIIELYTMAKASGVEFRTGSGYLEIVTDSPVWQQKLEPHHAKIAAYLSVDAPLNGQPIPVEQHQRPGADSARPESAGSRTDSKKRRPKVTAMHKVEPEKVAWLWPNYLPLGTLALVMGRQGDGKSTWSCAIASTVTNGSEWPDGSGTAPKGSVLIMSAEDSLSTTLRPRLDAAGADVSKVKSLDGAIGRRSDGTVEYLNLSTSEDRDIVEQAIIDLGDCRLLIIDTIGDYLGTKTNENSNSDVRAVLGPLRALAEKHGVCIVMVTHMNKSTEGDAMSRALSSTAFSAISRVHLVIAQDREDAGGQRRVMAVCKSNLGRARIGHAFEVHEADNGATRVEWVGGTIEVDADDLVRPHRGRDATKTKAAMEWLEGVLADGPVPSNVVNEAAKENGHAMRTLKEARKRLGVVAKRDGPMGENSGLTWRLHPPRTASEKGPTEDP